MYEVILKSSDESANLKKFNEVMTRYRNGEFGNEHLSLAEILYLAKEENLISQMNISELQYLIDNCSGITKMMYLELKKNIENSSPVLSKNKN